MDLTISSSLMTITGAAETDKFKYSVTYKINGKSIEEMTIGVTRKLTTEEAAQTATFAGSVNFIKGNLSTSLILAMPSDDRILAVTEASAIYEQIKAEVAAV